MGRFPLLFVIGSGIFGAGAASVRFARELMVVELDIVDLEWSHRELFVSSVVVHYQLTLRPTGVKMQSLTMLDFRRRVQSRLLVVIRIYLLFVCCPLFSPS